MVMICHRFLSNLSDRNRCHVEAVLSNVRIIPAARHSVWTHSGFGRAVRSNRESNISGRSGRGQRESCEIRCQFIDCYLWWKELKRFTFFTFGAEEKTANWFVSIWYDWNVIGKLLWAVNFSHALDIIHKHKKKKQKTKENRKTSKMESFPLYLSQQKLMLAILFRVVIPCRIAERYIFQFYRIPFCIDKETIDANNFICATASNAHALISHRLGSLALLVQCIHIRIVVNYKRW